MKLTYLDSGVLIAATRGDSKLFEAAYEIINDPDREFVVSDILKLELLPKATFEKNADEVDFYTTFFLKAVQTIDTTPKKTSDTLALACKYGLHAIDALHIQTGVDANISEFVTTEKPTKPFFRVTNLTFKLTSIC